MDWNNVYRAICENAKNQNRSKKNGYYEWHHIQPKSIFPELASNKDNLVLLTAREHYFCHKLLTKIYNIGPNHSKMVYALWIISNRLKIKSSREYEHLRIEYIKCMNENPKHVATRFGHKEPWNKGKKMSKEYCEKCRKANLGKKYPNRKKIILDEETNKIRKEKISKSLTGYKRENVDAYKSAARRRVAKKMNYKILLVNTGEIFNCYAEIKDKYPQVSEHVTECLSGKRHYCGILNGEKMIWKKVDLN